MEPQHADDSICFNTLVLLSVALRLGFHME